MTKPSRKHQKGIRCSFVDLRRTDTKSPVEMKTKLIDTQTSIVVTTPLKIFEELKRDVPQLFCERPRLWRGGINLKHSPWVNLFRQIPVPFRIEVVDGFDLGRLWDIVIPAPRIHIRHVCIALFCWKKQTESSQPRPLELKMPLHRFIEICWRWRTGNGFTFSFQISYTVEILVSCPTTPTRIVSLYRSLSTQLAKMDGHLALPGDFG